MRVFLLPKAALESPPSRFVVPRETKITMQSIHIFILLHSVVPFWFPNPLKAYKKRRGLTERYMLSFQIRTFSFRRIFCFGRCRFVGAGVQGLVISVKYRLLAVKAHVDILRGDSFKVRGNTQLNTDAL